MKYSEFKPGDRFDFSLCQGWFDVSVGPDNISLRTNCTEVCEFTGKESSVQYKNMLSQIKKAEEQGAYDLPF